jgi:hypothetical protein
MILSYYAEVTDSSSIERILEESRLIITSGLFNRCEKLNITIVNPIREEWLEYFWKSIDTNNKVTYSEI